MTPTAPQPRAIVLLALAAAFTLACGLVFSATSTPVADATKVALQLQATSMSLQLTQTALEAQSQPQSTPEPAGEAATPETEAAAATATSTARAIVPLQYGAIELAYGEKRGSYPRKSEGTTFGFQGTEGDVITIVLASSNARPQDSRCKDWVASTNFSLRLPSGEVPATVESAHLSSLRDYKLPGSAAYYIWVTCSGSGCNGYCTEADISLDKKE